MSSFTHDTCNSHNTVDNCNSSEEESDEDDDEVGSLVDFIVNDEVTDAMDCTSTDRGSSSSSSSSDDGDDNSTDDEDSDENSDRDDTVARTSDNAHVPLELDVDVPAMEERDPGYVAEPRTDEPNPNCPEVPGAIQGNAVDDASTPSLISNIPTVGTLDVVCETGGAAMVYVNSEDGDITNTTESIASEITCSPVRDKTEPALKSNVNNDTENAYLHKKQNKKRSSDDREYLLKSEKELIDDLKDDERNLYMTAMNFTEARPRRKRAGIPPCRFVDEYSADIRSVVLADVPQEELHAAIHGELTSDDDGSNNDTDSDYTQSNHESQSNHE